MAKSIDSIVVARLDEVKSYEPHNAGERLFFIPKSTFFTSIQKLLIRKSVSDIHRIGRDTSPSMSLDIVEELGMDFFDVLTLETFAIGRIGDDSI